MEAIDTHLISRFARESVLKALLSLIGADELMGRILHFLDRNFITICQAIPSAIRFCGDRPKNLLIESFKGCLPEDIRKRKKAGFIFPFGSWIGNSNGHPIFNKKCEGANWHWSKKWACMIIYWFSSN